MFPVAFTLTLMFQVSTPVELPTMTLPPKQETPKTATFTPSSTSFKVPSTNHKVPVASNPVSVSGLDSRVSSSAAKPPVDDADEELDQLLSLEKPVSGNQSAMVADEKSDGPEKGENIQHALRIWLCSLYFFHTLMKGFRISLDEQSSQKGSSSDCCSSSNLIITTRVTIFPSCVLLTCSVWGSGTGGDRREDGGGERQRRHASQVCFHQTGNDRGGPGGLAGQHDLLTVLIKEQKEEAYKGTSTLEFKDVNPLKKTNQPTPGWFGNTWGYHGNRKCGLIVQQTLLELQKYTKATDASVYRAAKLTSV